MPDKPTDSVTKGNLDDRLAALRERMDGHWMLDDERWDAHKAVHEAVADSLRDYKREANEWRATLSDLRTTFIPKAEFASEHRALDAKLHGETERLAGKLDTLDSRLDIIAQDIKTMHTEGLARRSVFSDGRSIITTISIGFGLVVTILLIIDRLNR